jgi:hypothetical protein
MRGISPFSFCFTSFVVFFVITQQQMNNRWGAEGQFFGGWPLTNYWGNRPLPGEVIFYRILY